MPRSNRPRRSPSRQRSTGAPVQSRTWDLGTDGSWRHHGVSTLQEFSDGAWHVRVIPSYGALKDYVCPGCSQRIAPGVSHVVAWRADGPRSNAQQEADRRHWHQRCWNHHAGRA
jgi:hypothetical protein